VRSHRRHWLQCGWVAFCLGSFVAAGPALADIFLWVDESGQTHATNDPESIPETVQSVDGSAAGLEHLWEGEWAGPPPPEDPAGFMNGGDARVRRLLRGAVADLERGESARAVVALEAVLRLEPGRPEAHWYLALLDRQRGRFESAARHLEAFLAHAGDELEDWRASAERRLRSLQDERRLASDGGRGLEFHFLESSHFRISYDTQLAQMSAGYPSTVVRYLEEAYRHGRERLAVAPAEATGVVLYGKAAYLAAHGDRFSFPTVGFYDGRIHVVSAAHPAGELRGLLFHEYIHALFRERTGGHRPFWLNEGFAELAERASRRREALTRSERSELRRNIDAETWIPLRVLAPGFGGLTPGQARLAYLESTAAAQWIEERTTATERRELLDRLGTGVTPDDALRAIVGYDTDAIDAAIQRNIAAHFPAGSS